MRIRSPQYKNEDRVFINYKSDELLDDGEMDVRLHQRQCIQKLWNKPFISFK
jgi:hypothetical protein